MKISSTGPSSASSLRRVARQGGDGSGPFNELLKGSDRPDPPAAAKVARSTPVSSLLAVQEFEGGGSRPAMARKRAADLLDQLDAIRHGLLAGALSRLELERLGRLLRTRRAEVDDPLLLEILDQIELRAEVELAKYSTLD